MRECIDALDAALNDTLSFDFETAEPPREAPPRERTPEQGPVGRAPVKAASASPGPPTPGVIDGQALWEELRQSAHPARTRLEPMRSGTPRMLLLLAGLAAAALAAFVWLPRYARVQPEAPTALVNGTPAAGGAAAAFSAQRTVFDSRLAPLESRGAGVWGGADFAAAKTRAAESVGAYDAGSLTLAQQRLAQASGLLDAAQRAAPAALAALGAGRLEEARAAFLRARSLRPDGTEAAEGLRRVDAVTG